MNPGARPARLLRAEHDVLMLILRRLTAG